MIKNILWDVDGTLFDTYPAITFAISKTLKEAGVSATMNMIDGLARRSLEYCLQTLSQRFKLDLDLLRRRFTESYETVSPANQPPFPGVREVCELIHTNGGLNIIVTHRAVSSARSLLEVHDMAPLFEAVFSVEQGHPRKPDPAMLEAAIRQFELDKTETMVVGDRNIDIQAGRAAGVHTFLFGQTQIAVPVDFKMDDYGQLLEMLKESRRRLINGTSSGM